MIEFVLNLVNHVGLVICVELVQTICAIQRILHAVDRVEKVSSDQQMFGLRYYVTSKQRTIKVFQ